MLHRQQQMTCNSFCQTIERSDLHIRRWTFDVQCSTFRKKLLLETILFSIAILISFLINPLASDAAVIKDLRIGNNNEYVRLVLEFDAPPATAPTYTAKGNNLKIVLDGMGNDLPARRAGDYSDIVILDLSQRKDDTLVDAVFPFTPVDIKAFTLVAPHRFIIDAYRPNPLASANQTEPGQRSDRGMSGQAGAGSIKQNHFFQHMITPLIAVTSTMLIVLVIVILISRRRRPVGPVAIGHLPPVHDPEIERIDAKIREHLGMEIDIS